MDLFFMKKNPFRGTPNGFHNYVPFWRYRKEDKNDWYLIHNIHVLYTGTYTIASFIQCSDRSNIDVVI